MATVTKPTLLRTEHAPPNSHKLTFGSLFAGIGGFDLGFERAGMRCVWQVEIDDYCRRVLAKHWPDVRRWDDVRTFPPAPIDQWRCDVICGGFPCQDISNAGKRAGITGERSGLWTEFARIVGVVRPKYIVVENVAALLGRGMGVVLGDLATLGYDAEWHVISAASVGAPHIRERVWIVAHSAGNLRGASWHEVPESFNWPGATMADADCNRRQPRRSGNSAKVEKRRKLNRSSGGLVFSDSDRQSLGRIAESRGQRGEWATEPDVGRVANGVPSRVDRLRGLGNAVVPQVSEWIGRRIVEAAQ